MNESELKPCPFCGAREARIDGIRIQQNGYRVTANGKTPTWWEVACDVCDFTVHASDTREECVNAWNQRYAPDGGNKE